jgi:ankyrin repeat protein
VDHLIIVTIICVLHVQDGNTTLFKACGGGRTECTELLLQAGADVDKTHMGIVSHSFAHAILQNFCCWLALSGAFHQCQCLAYD